MDINTMEQNIEREMNASAALEIQRKLIERYLDFNLKQIEYLIFSNELLEEIYEINPCSELLRKWQLRLLEDKTSRSSI